MGNFLSFPLQRKCESHFFCWKDKENNFREKNSFICDNTLNKNSSVIISLVESLFNSRKLSIRNCLWSFEANTETWFKTPIEFFLNECHWIQRFQWIMTKSKNSIVTTGTTYLDIVTFPVIVVESTFSLLPMGRYLLPLTTLNRYLSRHSSKNFVFSTSSVNITFTRCGKFLVTFPFLCFVTIHWIQWIQRKSFRKNSSEYQMFM